MADQMLPYEDLCREEDAHTCWRGLCTAHMDAHLKANQDALDFRRGDVLSALASRRIDVMELCTEEGP